MRSAFIPFIKVLEFVDDHGNEVLNLGSFALLPQVSLVLSALPLLHAACGTSDTGPGGTQGG